MTSVEPNRIPLLEKLHEGGDVAHSPEHSLAPSLAFRRIGSEPLLNHGQAERLESGRMGMEHPLAPKKLGVGNRAPSRNPDKHMKVIGEETVGYDLYSAKVSRLPKLLSKDLLCGVIE